jgi:hypothetical protein
VVPPRTPLPTTRPPPPDPAAPAEQRKTLVPPFSPEAFARDAERKLGAPPAFKEEAPPTPRQPDPAAALAPAGPEEPTSASTPVDDAPRPAPRGSNEPIRIPLVRVVRKAPPSPEALAADAAVEKECLSVIGSGSAVLVVALSPHELTGLVLDAESGFLLSLMDGATDVETLVDLSGLPRLPALRALRKLVVRGVAKPRSQKRP